MSRKNLRSQLIEATKKNRRELLTRDAKAKEGPKQLTFDGFDNFVSKLGLNNDNMLSAGEFTFNLMTRNRIQLEAAYRGSWVSGQVIDIWAEDMTKAGIDITTNEQAQLIPKMQKALIRRGIHSSLCSLIKWGRLYGGAIAVLQIEGQDMSTPLRLDTVGKKQFKGLAVYDRWQLQPDLIRVIKSGPDLGLPEFYQIVTTAASAVAAAPTQTGLVTVHHSRVIRNIGIELPFWQAITEQEWGESVLERLWDQLITYASGTMSAANLIERANNRHVGIEGLREILAIGGKQQAALEAQFQMMATFESNMGINLLDKNDEYSVTTYTFAGLDDLLLQMGQQLGGASNIPLVRFFGQSPKGLNSTGDADLRTYYDNINSNQNTKIRNAWELILNVMWRSEFGQKPPSDLEFEFVSLWQMTPVDKATVSKTNTETIIGAHSEGLIKASTAMQELRQMSGNTGLFNNITDEDIDEADAMDDLLPKPGEIDPNAPPPKENPDDPEKEPVKNLDSAIKLTPMQKIKAWLAKG